MRKRILESNMMSWVGTRVSTLCSLALVVPMAISLSSCEPNEYPNPNPNPAKEKGAGVEVLIEYENSVTSHTRTVSADSDYSFEKHGQGGVIEAEGLRWYQAEKANGVYGEIKPQLTFYAQENVVFQGWSWRYEDDPVGTHRDKDGKIISDFIETPTIQTEAGLQKLDIKADQTTFTCHYRPTSNHNRVYVKVKYAKTSDFKEKRASLYFAPIFTDVHMKNFRDFMGHVDPVNPDYENPQDKYYNLYGWWVASDIDSAITEGDFLSKFGVDLYIERGDLNPLVIAGEKLKVDMTISGSIIPICRFIFDFNQYPHNKFYIFRKMYEDKRTLSENHVVSFYIKPEHHEGHYEEWAERGASSPYGGDPRVDTSGNAYRELLNAVEFDLLNYSRKSFGEEWYSNRQLVKFDSWLMTERNGWKITSAKVAPIFLDDTIYYFDVRF